MPSPPYRIMGEHVFVAHAPFPWWLISRIVVGCLTWSPPPSRPLLVLRGILLTRTFFVWCTCLKVSLPFNFWRHSVVFSRFFQLSPSYALLCFFYQIDPRSWGFFQGGGSDPSMPFPLSYDFHDLALLSGFPKGMDFFPPLPLQRPLKRTVLPARGDDPSLTLGPFFSFMILSPF